jgi:asparagine synthase (glutamine-hydrolysing)
VIPKLPEIYDEPFADNSQIPTYLLAAMAREHVTVALSGDAGDELFGGYERYLIAERFWRAMAPIPRPARDLLARVFETMPRGALNRWGAAGRFSTFADRVQRAAASLSTRSPADLTAAISARWPSRGIVLGGTEPDSPYTQSSDLGLGTVETLMELDLETYLPDDILTKVDRAAMAVSLETRIPFLDHELVEFAWRLPFRQKVRNGRGKWILRQLLQRYLPVDLIERPKMGFSMPVDQWLRGPLREWAEELLAPSRLQAEGFFDPEKIREAWRLHQSGQANLRGPLWSALIFQAWWSAEQGR